MDVSANKWYMLAPQFDDVSNGGSDTIDLLKIMDLEGVTVQTWANRASATQIQVYNPASSAYTIYYYTVNNNVTGWRRNPTPSTSLPVAIGSGVWLKVAEATDGKIKMAGQVKSAESVTVNVGGDGEWTIASNPYPTALTQGNMTTTGITEQPWANRAAASQLQVYNPDTESYTIFYYTSGNGGTAWRKSPAAPTSTDVICPVGSSFWVKSSTSGTLTFSL